MEVEEICHEVLMYLNHVSDIAALFVSAHRYRGAIASHSFSDIVLSDLGNIQFARQCLNCEAVVRVKLHSVPISVVSLPSVTFPNLEPLHESVGAIPAASNTRNRAVY